MGQINPTIPVTGNLNSVADPEVSNALTAIIQLVNGNLDATNMSASFLQAVAANVGGQLVKGYVNNTGPGARTNTAYGALGDAADSVSVTVPSPAVVAVRFQAQWKESFANGARAALFVDANQVVAAVGGGSPPVITSAYLNAGAVTGVWTTLTSCDLGLTSGRSAVADIGSGSVGANVTTGQVVGQARVSATPTVLLDSTETVGTAYGHECVLFMAPGTHTISVQYKAVAGTVTAQSRQLWVNVISFA